MYLFSYTIFEPHIRPILKLFSTQLIQDPRTINIYTYTYIRMHIHIYILSVLWGNNLNL